MLIPTAQKHKHIWSYVTYETPSIKGCSSRLRSGAVQSVGLQPLDYCYRGFDSRRDMDVRLFCFFVCCAGSSLCNELTTRSEESYR